MMGLVSSQFARPGNFPHRFSDRQEQLNATASVAVQLRSSTAKLGKFCWKYFIKQSVHIVNPNPTSLNRSETCSKKVCKHVLLHFFFGYRSQLLTDVDHLYTIESHAVLQAV
jgi:hypothetical protein